MPPPGRAPRAEPAPGDRSQPVPLPVPALAADRPAAQQSPGPVAPTGEALHPALWRAHQLARANTAVLPSGFSALDLQLPGGGWPTGVLTELLLPQPGVGELRLLAPLLVALQQAQRSVVWFDPPAWPCAAGLAQLGLDMRRLVVVQGQGQGQGQQWQGQGQGQPQGSAGPGLSRRSPGRAAPSAADTLWALEQALKSGHLGAVLAWLPSRLPAEVLRRLQLAAQAHDGVALLLRHGSLATKPSPAPLRLTLACAGPDRLRVTVLKRRGPPALQPLWLHLQPVLSDSAAARAALGSAAQAALAQTATTPA